MTKDGAQFLVIFSLGKELSGELNGKVKIEPYTEKYLRYYGDEWFVGENREQMDWTTGCSLARGRENKICVLGLVLTYHPHSGFLTIAREDFNLSKHVFSNLTADMIGSLIAHVEWPTEHIFQLDTVIGYLPCNVKWSNVLRFDPSSREGKCLHFSAASKGTIFVVFAAVPNDKNTWYYVQISPYGVGIFKVNF